MTVAHSASKWCTCNVEVLHIINSLTLRRRVGGENMGMKSFNYAKAFQYSHGVHGHFDGELIRS